MKRGTNIGGRAGAPCPPKDVVGLPENGRDSVPSLPKNVAQGRARTLSAPHVVSADGQREDRRHGVASLPQRKGLNHPPPFWVRAEDAVYFITIYCQPRGEQSVVTAGGGGADIRVGGVSAAARRLVGADLCVDAGSCAHVGEFSGEKGGHGGGADGVRALPALRRSEHIHSSLGFRFPKDFGTKTRCGDEVGSLGEGSVLVNVGEKQ